jgi:hypothetical protein
MASRGAASGGKMSGRRVEARENRRCRGAAGYGGGGAAIEKQRRGQRAEQGCQRKKKERRGSEGPLWNFQKSEGPFCKVKFPTNLRLKQKCDQNESCTTFQALQLCFRIQLQKLKRYSFI